MSYWVTFLTLLLGLPYNTNNTTPHSEEEVNPSYLHTFIVGLSKNPFLSWLLFLCTLHLSPTLLPPSSPSLLAMEPEPQLYIYDINRKADISQSAQLGAHGLLKEYIDTLQMFLNDETVWVMHSSYSPDSAHITIDSSRGGNK